ncbi:hypothetical protein E1A91_D07G214900v1 [Gossypium mustelinum]|uniref:RING-type domain-containing protein n=3 Tax=Gossypium TaxID=3633 RepID=A0A0D2NCE1_GOSRA|nr:hypothetical protein B456_001G212700 [Gossypium raimondii]TYI74631.1 hypothetical protein E1A91_D07G214900v1 [Gossypium mustelinum]
MIHSILNSCFIIGGSMAVPPAAAEIDVETPLNLVGILSVVASFPMTVFIIYIIRTCYEKARRQLRHPTQDIEAGRQSMRQPAGTVVIYKKNNIISTQETTAKEEESGSKDCAICLEELKEGDRCRMLSKCRHVYHLSCIDRWLLKHSHCPLCRASIYAS